MVEVIVRMRKGNRTVTAMGVREDIVMASMEAVISGMNVLTTDYNNKNQPVALKNDLYLIIYRQKVVVVAQLLQTLLQLKTVDFCGTYLN